MSSRDRGAVAKDVIASIVVTGALAVGAAVAHTAPAAADPPAPPADPAIPVPPPQGPTIPIIGAPLGPSGLSGLAQIGAPAAGPLGLPEMPDPTVGNDLMLGQNPIPSPPGGPPGTPPNLNAFNNAYLLPQNVDPAAPGQGTMFGVAPGDENADISGLDYLRRLRAMYSDDRLKGGLLGQMPLDQLGEPLPGTAPPPGTAIPAGLGQVLPDQPPIVSPGPPPVSPPGPPPAG